MSEYILNSDIKNRFFTKIKIPVEPDGCHIWTAFKDNNGYGQFKLNKITVSAHVIAYKLHYGDYNSSRINQINHKCKNTSCVNPLHLELVTNVVNTLDSNNPCAINARKTFCKNGHEFTPENTYIYKDNARKGGRGCNICRRAAVKRYRGI